MTLLKLRLLIAKLKKLILVKGFNFLDGLSRKALEFLVKKELDQRKIIDNLDQKIYFKNLTPRARGAANESRQN